MKNYKRTVIKSLIWSGAFALLLAGVLLIGQLTQESRIMGWVLIGVCLAATVAYFLMRKGEVWWLQLLLCAVPATGAAFCGIPWLSAITFHKHGTYIDFSGIEYYLVFFFLILLFGSDLIIQCVKAVVELYKRKELERAMAEVTAEDATNN